MDRTFSIAPLDRTTHAFFGVLGVTAVAVVSNGFLAAFAWTPEPVVRVAMAALPFLG